MRRLAPIIVSLAFVLASAVGAAPVAQAATTAYPVAPFRVEYGNTYTAGTVTFYNRSVTIAGEQKAVSSSGCRSTVGEALDAAGERISFYGGAPTTCNASEKFSFSFDADVPGGAASVVVRLCYAEEYSCRFLASQKVPRP